ncbi:glycosyltransferase family 2 protein [candidate division KSB1 bacterium]|nr:glycosyltransferase family 2 protein [candidate division KSB1 bacterium]
MNSIQNSFENPKVSIILVNWNNSYDTIECIESLKQLIYYNNEIIVVDNNSTYDSIKELENVDNINLIQNNNNLGFAGGNNVGIEFALKGNSDYVLLLNNDTVVDERFLSILIKGATEEKNIGIIGGKIYYYNEPAKIWSAGGGLTKTTKRTFQYGENKIDKKQYNREKEVDFLSGCCMLIRREVFEKIGLLDADYFMYYEDVDFCLRAKKFFKIVYIPEALIWHKVSATTEKSFRDYYRMRNYLILLKKRFDTNSFLILLFSSFIFFERLSRMFVRKIFFNGSEKLSSRFSALVSGLIAGVRNRSKK